MWTLVQDRRVAHDIFAAGKRTSSLVFHQNEGRLPELRKFQKPRLDDSLLHEPSVCFRSRNYPNLRGLPGFQAPDNIGPCLRDLYSK